MRAKRNSIFVALLALAHFISNDCLLAEEISTLQAAEPTAGDILQKQRVDEIRELTAMKNKAAADREARDKAATQNRENAEKNAAALAARAARESSAKELLESAEKAASVLSIENVLSIEKAAEQAGQEILGISSAKSAVGIDIITAAAVGIEMAAQTVSTTQTVESVLPDSVSVAVSGARESSEQVIQESGQRDTIIPLINTALESVVEEATEAVSAVAAVAAEKITDAISDVKETAAVVDAAIIEVAPEVLSGLRLSNVSVEQIISETSSTVSSLLDSIPAKATESSEQVIEESSQKEIITPVVDEVAVPVVITAAGSDASVDPIILAAPIVTPEGVIGTAILDSIDTKTVEKENESTADDSSEDDVMKEIMEMQQRELMDELEEGKQILNDSAEAEQAESSAKAAEAAAEIELARLEREEAALKKKKAAAADDWISRTRPGGEAKPGAKLAQTIASGIRGNSDEVDEMSSRMGRERIPDSSRKGSQSGGRSNYFAGQTATEKEAENKRKEAQNRAKETDKMSTGGGDRRRELEAKLSSKMRDSAQAKQQEQVEEELESRARRARAVISRKFSRPVERVLRVYNSDSTDLYDVLQVNKEADDSALKKAYRSLALSVHPDKNIHPDAKMAFDAIQEAYETLSSPVKKMIYNTELKKRSSKPSLKRLIYQIKGEVSNIKSRILLFWVRVFVRGESELEYKELIGDRITAVVTGIRHTAEHFTLLPTVLDRVRLASEISFDSRRNLLLGSVVSAFLSDL